LLWYAESFSFVTNDRRRTDLFSDDNTGPALADEPEELGPEVALVGKSFAGPGDAERLARATAGPDGTVVWPPCASERVRPRGDAGEEVALRETANVGSLNIDN
jgi:hypothetical protein